MVEMSANYAIHGAFLRSFRPKDTNVHVKKGKHLRTSMYIAGWTSADHICIFS